MKGKIQNECNIILGLRLDHNPLAYENCYNTFSNAQDIRLAEIVSEFNKNYTYSKGFQEILFH